MDTDEFAGEIRKTKTIHAKNGASEIVTEDFFKYDNLGRVVLHTQKVNGGNEERISANNYNEVGALIKKDIGNLKNSQPLIVQSTFMIVMVI